jgi:small-conductance mechanosensitive channel
MIHSLRLVCGFLAVFCLVAAFGALAPQSGSSLSPVTSAFAQTSVDVEEQGAITAIDRRTQSLKNAYESAQDDDEALALLRGEADEIVQEAGDLLASIEERLKSSQDALAALGDAPADSAAIDPEVARQRGELEAQVQNMQARVVALNTHVNDARRIQAQIAEARRNAFTNSILKRTVFTDQLLSDAVTSYQRRFSEIRLLFRNWLVLSAKNTPGVFFGSLALGVGVSLLLWMILRRTITGTLRRRKDGDSPTLFRKLNVAFWRTLVSSALVLVCLGTIYWALQWAEIMGPRVDSLVYLLVLLGTGLSFIWYLSTAILTPTRPRWRLVPLTNGGAHRLRILVMFSAVAYAMVYAGEYISKVLDTSLAFTVGTGLIAALLQGVVLLLMALMTPIAKLVPEEQGQHEGESKAVPMPTMSSEDGISIDELDLSGPGERWPALLRLPLFLAAIGIVVCAVAGYVGLASFISRQIVVTGAILATMYLGYIASREVGREGVFANTSMGGRIKRGLGLGQRGVEQTGLFVGVLGFVLICVIGLPLIALQWGAQVTDIGLFMRRILTGVEIGSVRLSLSGILFGIFMFAAVYFLTRFFQRWLDMGVLARSRVDSGVRDSIRKGVGYGGIALAILIGITSAGINLSSLAIVAGALSLGIGFGLQNIVQNFVSGLILLVERPIKTGDIITAGGFDGTVSQISVRATQLATFDQKTVTIPNSELINGAVNNWTHKSRSARYDISVGVNYGSDTRLVERLLLDIAMDQPKVLNDPAPWVLFSDFGASSLDFTLFIYLANISDGIATRNEIRHQIVEIFEENKIGIPFPQRDLNLKVQDMDIIMQKGRERSAEDGGGTHSDEIPDTEKEIK